jgi:hypothetical protein
VIRSDIGLTSSPVGAESGNRGGAFGRIALAVLPAFAVGCDCSGYSAYAGAEAGMDGSADDPDAGDVEPCRGHEPRRLDDSALVSSHESVVDAQGRATIVWNEGDSSVSARRYASGAWSDREVVSASTAGWIGATSNRAGQVLVAWPTGTEVQAASWQPETGWSEPDPIAPSSNDGTPPSVAIDDDGTSIAMWIELSGETSRVLASARNDGGEWGPVDEIDPSGVHWGRPEVVPFGDTGSFTTLFMRGIEPMTLQWTDRDGASGVWSRPAQLRTQTEVVPNASVVTVAGEEEVALWEQAGTGSDHALWSATRGIGAGWSEPVLLSEAAATVPLGLAAGADRVHAAWEDWGIWTAAASAGQWAPALPLQEGMSSQSVAVAAEGDRAVVVWRPVDVGEPVRFASYRSGSWSGSSPIESAAPGGHSLAVTLAPNGQATISWETAGALYATVICLE